MKTPNISAKDILKKLSFLKSNLSLLVPILIAVVALLLFIPTRILGGKLRSTVEQQSAQKARTIAALNNQIEEAAQAKRMEPYITAYARDANQIELMMTQTTQRELLSYRIFPDTNERTTLLFEEFSQHYRAGIEAMLKSESVRAGVPPTWADITAAIKKAPQTSMYGDYMPTMELPSAMTQSSPYGYEGGYGMDLSSMMMTDTQRKIFDTICLEKARSAGIYANLADLGGYVYWSDWKFENRDAAYRDCWYWQMAYWMIEDVIATIGQMNKGAGNVLDAPVKRLMNVSFVFNRTMGRSLRRPGMGMGGLRGGKRESEYPTYVVNAKTGMTTPCTGRFCNEEIDVMHFNVRVIVDAGSTMTFMKELCSAKPHQFRGWNGREPAQTFQHNQITILENSIAPVDPMSMQHFFHKYGDAPTVELDMICEYILDKPAYEHMKPQQAKDDIVSASDTTKKR